jgi:hypothetical protein
LQRLKLYSHACGMSWVARGCEVIWYDSHGREAVSTPCQKGGLT